jgi:hypothetical protein
MDVNRSKKPNGRRRKNRAAKGFQNPKGAPISLNPVKMIPILIHTIGTRMSDLDVVEEIYATGLDLSGKRRISSSSK